MTDMEVDEFFHLSARLVGVTPMDAEDEWQWGGMSGQSFLTSLIRSLFLIKRVISAVTFFKWNGWVPKSINIHN